MNEREEGMLDLLFNFTYLSFYRSVSRMLLDTAEMNYNSKEITLLNTLIMLMHF